MKGQHDVLNFIGRTFPSAWGVEVLRFLAQAERPCSRAELIASLRASEGALQQSVVALSAAGLIEAGSDGSLSFRPSDPCLLELTLAAIALYEQYPDLVRRTIVSPASRGLTAFADAFKLRKD